MRIVIRMLDRSTQRRSPEQQDGARRERERGGRRPPLAELGELIQAKGLKRSKQRDAVAETFFAMGGHVSVDALLVRVRERDPRVSVATVYRTMKLLTECGLAVARRFGDGQARYEPATRRHPVAHDHLICTACGEIIEFESDRISGLQLKEARRHGFEIESRRVELYGRCARCRRSAETGSAA
ncbi:MAG TPA: transcriptional repressor [Anaeromyxobacteraceae bacterium]|nr:transcriptional repressor [Anaeromyxobacteraceae bacterium]